MTILNWPATLTIPGDGSMPLWIQCLDAPGQTTITNLTVPFGGAPAGWYRTDSFFDVVPEISLDDSIWTYSDQSGNMTLVPEPSGLALLCMGSLCLAIKTWRGRK